MPAPSPVLRVSRLLWVFCLVAACGGAKGCNACSGGVYEYPRTTPGKEPIENAAQVRINQAGLDFLAEHLSDVVAGLCCDPSKQATLLESPAETCWAKAPCFLDTVDEGGSPVTRVSFYIGTPGNPVFLTGADPAFNIQLRNGDPFRNPNRADGGYELSGSGTGESAARPYCNDLGGDICEQQLADLARFCRTSGSCNNPNPADPTQRDYCCGFDVHGVFNTNALDICEGKRALPRCSGYPSSVAMRLDQLTPEHVRITAVEEDTDGPGGVRVELLALDLGLDLRVAVANIPALGDATCGISDKVPAQGTVNQANIAFELRPRIDRSSGLGVLDFCDDCLRIEDFTFTLTDPKLDADKRDLLCQDENWIVGQVAADAECQTVCETADGGVFILSAIFNGLEPIVEWLKEPLGRQLAKVIGGQLDGLPVEISTQLDVRGLLAGTIDLRHGEPIGTFAGVHGDGMTVDGLGGARGLRVGLDVGFEADRHTCVPPDFAPLVTQGRDPELPPTIQVSDTSTLPPTDRTDVYHAAAAISEQALSRAMFSAFSSGIMCLGLDSYDIGKLTGGEQAIDAGLLFLLAPELEKIASPKAPILFQLEPRTAPRVKLGSGKPTGALDKNGKPAVDSLLQVDLEDLGMSFYVHAQDRYVRVFALSADLGLGFSILRGPDNLLQLSIDRLEVEHVESTFNELGDTDFSSVVAVILNLATGTVLSNRLTFDLDFASTLSQVLGSAPIYLRINDVQRAGRNDDYLAAFFTLCSDQDLLDPRKPVCSKGPAGPNVPHRSAQLGGEFMLPSLVPSLSEARPLYLPPAKPLPPSLRADSVPAGVVNVHVEEPGAAVAREYAVRVDMGLYHSLIRANQDGDIVVASPELLLPGKHRLEILSQRAGDYTSLSLAPAVLDLELDSERPLAILERFADGVRVTGSDLVTPEEELVLELRTRGAAGASRWQRFGFGGVLSGEALAGVHTVEARAVDRVGNVSAVSTLSWAVQPATGAVGTKRGCGATGSAALGPAFLALALILLRRRLGER